MSYITVIIEVLIDYTIAEMAAFVSAVSTICVVTWFLKMSYTTDFPYLGIVTLSDYLAATFTIAPIPILVSIAVSVALITSIKVLTNWSIKPLVVLFITTMVSVPCTYEFARLNTRMLSGNGNLFRIKIKDSGEEPKFFVGLTNGVLVKRQSDTSLTFYTWSRVESISKVANTRKKE